VWQSEVNKILIRTSFACGGATSTSSITNGFPASHATAAANAVTLSKMYDQDYKVT